MRNLCIKTVLAFSFILVPLSHLSPTPVPVPTPAITPPPQAAKANYTHLSFDEECNTPLDIGYGTDGHKWNAGLWWETVPSPSSFNVNSGILTITPSTSTNVNLCTQFHDYSGGTYFRGGYFEARMLCNDWSAFWLFCAHRPWVNGSLVTSDPLTQTSEIDVIETDPGAAYVNTVTTTVHRNTSGDGGIRDAHNRNNNHVINSTVLGVMHIFGVLWTAEKLTWYVDNVRVCTCRAFPSTWQPMQLILGVGPGGVNGSASTMIPPKMVVDWVRVWQ
jgi:Glycosyl hydrolases family 16